MLGIVKRTFFRFDKEMFLILYKSHIRPFLEVNSVVLSPHLIKDKKVLENVQRRANKLVIRIKDWEYEDRLKFLGLPTLEYRRVRADMIEVYKMFHAKSRINPDDFFEKPHSSSTRGHPFKFYKVRYRLDFRKISFAIRVVEPWNSLPELVVLAASLNMFKTRLNKEWNRHPLKFKFSIIN